MGENDSNKEYVNYLRDMSKHSYNYDYNKAKVIIAIWLIIATFGCLIIFHILMCTKEAREQLGKRLKSFISKYYESVIIFDIKKSSILQFKDEKIFFFFIKRVAFPMMLVAVVIITSFDIYLYWKYRNLHIYYNVNDNRFLYFFPIPCVAPTIFGVNFVMSVATTLWIFYWDKLKAKLTKILDELNKWNAKLKKCWDKLMKYEEAIPPLERDEGKKQKKYNIEENIAENEQESNNNRKDKLKQHCEKFLIFATLVLLFGVVYLFYHGFWMIIALLIYPVQVLVCGIFIVPLMFFTIPIWNTIIKIAENWFDACNESSCCISCCTYICSCCIHCCLVIIDFCICCCLVIIYPCICCYKNICKYCKNKRKWQPFCKGCVWLAILVYELLLWGLFIAILFYISRFLFGSNISEIKMYQLVFSCIGIAIFSGILACLNTELVIQPQNNKENQDEHQQEKKKNQDEQQQEKKENQDEHQQEKKENQDEQQQEKKENQDEQQQEKKETQDEYQQINEENQDGH